MTIRLLFVLAMLLPTLLQMQVGGFRAPIMEHGTSLRTAIAQSLNVNTCSASSAPLQEDAVMTYVTEGDIEVTAVELVCDTDHDDDPALPAMIVIAASAPFEQLRAPRRSDPDASRPPPERPPLC